MKLERTKNAIRNIIFGYVNKIVTILYPFIIRTLIIRRIGAEFLGLSSLFSSILQVLSLTELGFGSAIVFSMYKPIAENDNDTVCAILNFYRKVYLYIGLIILIIGLCVMPCIPKMISGSYPEGINVYFLYLIYLTNTVISYFMFAYKSSILNAYQRNDIISNINTAVFIISYTAQLIVIVFTKNYYLYAGTSIFASVLINISTAICTKKIFPNIVCKGKISKSLKGSIKTKVMGILLSRISAMTENAFDSIFLSMYLGLIETAIYNNYFYIMNSVSAFIIILYASMSAGIGNSIVTDPVEKNYDDMNKFNFIYMWITGFCAICLLCLYQPFTELVWGKEMLYRFIVVILFCVYFYIRRANDMLGLYYEANGFWWKGRYVDISNAVGNIVLNIIFGKIWGAVGIVAATVVSISITSNIFFPFITFKNYFKNQKILTYYISCCLYAVVTFCVGTIVLFVSNKINAVNIFSFVLRAVVVAVLTNVLYLFIYMKTPIFKKSANWIRAKLGG